MSDSANLGPAIAHFEAALALQPEQRIALERLSMIALSRGLTFANGHIRYLAFYRYQCSGDAQRAAWANQVADALERAGPANQNLPNP